MFDISVFNCSFEFTVAVLVSVLVVLSGLTICFKSSVAFSIKNFDISVFNCSFEFTVSSAVVAVISGLTICFKISAAFSIKMF